MRWGLVARSAILALFACTPPSSEEGAGSDDARPGTTSGGTTAAGTSSGTTESVATFGMDGPGVDGSGFVAPLDVACASGSPSSAGCSLCDVREQNCIDDFKCVPWAEDGGDAWTGTRCVETPRDPAGVGEPCRIVDGGLASGRDDCAAGSMCWAIDRSTLEGVCVPFCAPQDERPACPAGTGCMLDGYEVLALCLPPCDPLDGSACAQTETCRYFSASQGAFCIPDQGPELLSPTIQCGEQGQACGAAQVCVSAMTYGGCGEPSCCTAWCDVDDPAADVQCARQRADQICVPLFDGEPAPEGLASLGYCALPPDPA